LQLPEKTNNYLMEKYSRISRNIDFSRMLSVRLIVVGTGASHRLIEDLGRMGIKRFTLIDPDRVEEKNLAAQGFVHGDIGRPKVEALADRLREVEFEQGNPDMSPLTIETFHSDFTTLAAEEIGCLEEDKILLMTTDYHPAQARGNSLSIQFGIPTFWCGIYQGGRAGEIVFYDPIAPQLPCYRCITKSRYEAYETRLRNGAAGTKGAFSSGLPFATALVDSILGHLIIGAIHREVADNPHGMLFRKLLEEQRNFIQVQMDPDYRLAGVNIFDEFDGPNTICFNTMFQNDVRDPECPDCGKLQRC